jgi:DNA-directed RNA polymerase specialized sigma24 family protein
MPRRIDHDKRLTEARDRLVKADHEAEVARAKFRSAVVAAVGDGTGQGHIARLLSFSEKRVYDHLTRGRAEAGK